MTKYYLTITTDVAITSELTLGQLKAELSPQELDANITLINQQDTYSGEVLQVADVNVKEWDNL